MAFQDFAILSERRRNERKEKVKKRVIFGVLSSILIVCVIGAATFVLVNKTGSENNVNKKPTTASTDTKVEHYLKNIKTICSSTEYKAKCEGPLSEEVEKDPKLAQPKELLRLSMKLAEDEINKAFNKTMSMKFESEMDNGAYEDCKQLFDDARAEIGFSISEVRKNDLKKLSTRTPELNNWLSAVISYHQTCIDGFVNDELKTELKKLFQDPQEFVSNSLAIVKDMSSFLSTLEPSVTRHLLSEKIDDFPSWIGDADRRILKAADDKPTPNVTVAKDGSGNFKTISEALAAVPQSYTGRYIPLNPTRFGITDPYPLFTLLLLIFNLYSLCYLCGDWIDTCWIRLQREPSNYWRVLLLPGHEN
ncbi:putative pectinesterase [Lupinus albus]|uniref:Putative pectinesterase n=1 Tax=Lupinus albus TaxID=3870 RepID=A0A6A4Q2N0_LUPAL|nr:putative pectinesterase [Lupinus albus]